MTPAPFVHPLRVRYAECDPQRIVFNANYFAYFDVGMTELWRAAIGSYSEMMRRGGGQVGGGGAPRIFWGGRLRAAPTLQGSGRRPRATAATPTHPPGRRDAGEGRGG